MGHGTRRWLQRGSALVVAILGLLLMASGTATAAASWTRAYSGLSLPLDITSARDGTQRLFIAQQGGRVRLVKAGVLQPTPFLDLGALTAAAGEQGLLGVAFHPQYADNGLFVVNYTRASDGATVIARYNVSASNPDVADPLSAAILLVIAQPYANHNGGSVKFGPDGFLYIGMGDGGSANDPENRAQDKSSLLGKILRIDINVTKPLVGAPYSIPPGNPYPTGVGGRAEVFAIGLRNPFRIAFDRGTGDLWIGDVGQGAQEEIDRLPAGTGAGANLGWRVLEGTSCTGLSGPVSCTEPTLTAPVITYGRAVGQSVTGGFLYRGAAVPSLAGRYVYADFVSGRIWAAAGSGATWTATELADTGFNVSAFGEDEAGELYFADYGTGDIYRFTETTPPTPVLGVAPASLAFGSVTIGAATADQTVTITNNGGGTLVLSALTVGGTHPADFSRSGTCTSTSSLSAGVNCTVLVRFMPTAAGARSASVDVTSNAGNGVVALSGTGVVAAAPILAIAPASINFGNVNLGVASNSQSINVSNAGAGTLMLSALAFSGPNAAEFTRAGTCTATTTLTPPQTCTIVITFAPLAAGNRSGSVNVSSNGGGGLVTLAGTGVALPPPVALVATPGNLDFGAVNVGAASATATIVLSAQGTGSVRINAFTMGGDHAAEFIRGGSCGVGTTISGVQTCTLTFIFVPVVIGTRNATVSVASSGGTVNVTLAGTGATAGTSLAQVVEFYNAALDHYFVSALAADIQALDTGVFKGWQRTQRTFRAFATMQPGSSPVCRFYIPPALGDSHFISASPAECADVLVKFPAFTYETAAAMYMFLPHPVTGGCPAGAIPIYRVWNARLDSNHRYVDDRAVRDQMLARGYVQEGYGIDGVAMCAPL